MLTIASYGLPPQMLTCNCHCQGAFKVLFLDQSIFFISDHPAFSSSSAKVSFHANDFVYGPSFQTLTCNCHCKLPSRFCFWSSPFFVNDYPALFSSSIKISFHANDLAIWHSPQTLTCNRHMQAALKILLLDQSILFISNHPASFSSLVKDFPCYRSRYMGLLPKR